MIFEDLNVKPELVKGLKEIGVKEPTEIQKKTIPLIKEGKDVIGVSKTGSGKTIAFGIPILENVKPGGGIQYLIIAPVRELAVQIARELRKFGKYVKFSVTTVYGGVAINPQIEAMQRADIVVSTPGRLLDHLENFDLKLDKIKCVVLDEADKMVEMGFIEDIRRILNETPNQKQMLLFGATISNEIDELKQNYMHNPLTVQTESHVGEEYLEQYYYDVKQFEKFSLLVHLLKKEQKDLCIIFCSARSTVEMVTKNLRDNGIKCDMIHGKLTQNRRLRAIENFHKGNPTILVASAVAARGIDVKDVSHIFNYDLSPDAQEYVHRVGRTARAGKTGKAITLLSERDHDVFREILSRFPVNVEQLPLEDFERLRFDAGRRFGGRGSFRGGGRPGGRFGSRDDSRGYQGNRPRYGGRSSDSSSSYGGRDSSSGYGSKPHRRYGESYGRGDSSSQGQSYGRKDSSQGRSRSYGRGSSGHGRSFGKRY